MARISHIAFGFAFVLLLAGCSRDAEQEQQASNSLYWHPPGESELMPLSHDPLVLQLSADPVVYISHIPWKQELTDDEEPEGGIVVMPSTLDDILPRIAAFQGAQKATGEKAVLLIGGDGRAPCSSILTAIDYAKRAQVEFILFETGTWRPSGMAFKTSVGVPAIKYFEFPKDFKPSRELAKNIVTITISKNGVVQWGDTPVIREDLIRKLDSLVREIGRDKILFAVRVDADAPFPVLRYVLDEMRRTGIYKVAITQL